MNICLCGSMAGYPHDPACPYPLFRGTEAMEAAWEKEYLNRKGRLLPWLPDEVAPQNPVTDFFEVR